MLLLKNENARMTRARSAVISAVYGSKAPVSAPKIISILNRRGIDINKTTVYRELSFLVEKKVFKEVFLRPNIVHYESALLPHHHHLVCNDCGSVEEVDCVVSEKELSKKMKEKGFSIKNHKFEMYGVCARCG